ncbi:MAG: O-acetylhomoserine aminocarboxypropyltransferase/cysteine synthase [Proteobacteria bacterium]|nr:O-acetylhomoserine aminocarboxypropyltransferase/cysteine synthase [Pseudomonadota bacterium]
MADREFGIETLCLHAGQIPDAATGARAVPIYQTASYVFDDADHAASLFNLQTFGNTYTRMANPTTAVFEERMAALENGRAALAVSTGMAAQTTALLTLMEQGDELVSARTLYGGTYSQFDVPFRKLGIETHFVDSDDPENFRRAITPKTKALFAEIIGNPSNNVLDIEAVSAIAREAGIPLIVDSTFASPYLCRPIDFGADIVVHSATKFIGGHGTTMGGVIIESGKFDWANGNFPGMVEPSDGYHGIRFYETFGDFGFTMKARFETLRTMGPAASPFNSFMLLQGLETLHVRMDRHVENAVGVAKFLQDHAGISWVNYAGLEDNQYYPLAQKYLPKGAGSIMCFGIVGGKEAGTRFIEGVQFLSHLANVGDAKTLVIHPASTTHRQLSEEQQVTAGVTEDMIRISVGLETLDDILWDLDQALQKAQG